MTPDAPGLAEEMIAEDEAAVIAECIAFLKAATARRHRPGSPPPRFNQGRATAVVDAEFTVLDTLPPRLRVGLFAEPRTYRALIRFANASSASDREKDLRGMTLRLHDVPGTNLTPGVTVADFVLNSHPVMMAPDTRGFLELLQANEEGGLRRLLYFLRHPAALRVALAARTNPSCHLDLSYWSATPYLFGPGRAVKYIVRPGDERRSPVPGMLSDEYLKHAIEARLAETDATFDFMVQFQTDSRRMPIEDASVEWNHRESPYLTVARIRIPSQRIDDARVAEAEALAFNPWHCPAEHRPLGGMNRARREIYRAMAEFRGAASGRQTDTVTSEMRLPQRTG